MVLVTGNQRMWAIGMFVSLAIFGVLYFTVIKPSSDTANQAVKTGLQQSQQALSQAQQQVSSATGAASGANGTQVKAATGQVASALSNAQKLTACVSAAGTDATQLQACQVKFAH